LVSAAEHPEMLKRLLTLNMTVVEGQEVQAAREMWAQLAPEGRQCLARLACEIVLLREAGSDQRVILADASILEAAGLPFSGV
jgi:hypothetical protein